MAEYLPPGKLSELIGRRLFDIVPLNIAVIDRELKVIAANKNFEEYFGEWEGRFCFEVCKQRGEKCSQCEAHLVFSDGKVRVSDETGVDNFGRTCHYVVHLAPIRDDAGKVQYVVEMSTDVTEVHRWQRHYNLLFERVPCYITIIDKDYKIIRANEKFCETFGEARGRHCFQVYKRRPKPCPDCPAALTFADGKEHAAPQKGITVLGDDSYYMVTTAPLARGEEGVAHVIEIAADVTEEKNLERTLRETRDLYKSLIKNSATGIIAIDQAGKPRMLNETAKKILELDAGQMISAEDMKPLLPVEFFAPTGKNDVIANLAESEIQTIDGVRVPVSFHAVELRSAGEKIGRAAFFNDLRPIKQLEREKLDNERLAAVGQTVAGLAHTIKNLLMGLEGGMYMVDTGLRKGDASRIVSGWDVLQRNFNKTTELVKDFLAFAKGRMPRLRLIQPNDLARDIVKLYFDAAKQQGIELSCDLQADLPAVPLDPEGMEACLTNLVSNGIDAAMWKESEHGQVCIRTRDEGGDLIIEVQDNGTGMDREVKQKVFTTFFTTKGGKGTGLGLLTTRKIVQEHGGSMEVESEEGIGSTFRIRLPRNRLQALMVQVKDSED